MSGIASSPIDPFAPDFLMDPYPAYEALRARSGLRSRWSGMACGPWQATPKSSRR
ncbi:hypothetical protein ABIF99_003813 [Bradyrhizobium japonicum]